jgi:hypothetical protein
MCCEGKPVNATLRLCTDGDGICRRQQAPVFVNCTARELVMPSGTLPKALDGVARRAGATRCPLSLNSQNYLRYCS